jgi:hypothetical protein
MRWLLLALAVAVVPAVFVARELYWEPICGEEVLSERKSPNEVFVFSVHRRNCGATTGYVTGFVDPTSERRFGPIGQRRRSCHRWRRLGDRILDR